MDKTTIIRGPAVLKLGATVIYTEDDLTVTAEIATTEGKNAIVGKYDEFQDTVIHTVSFKPASQASADYFAVLFPYANPVLGSLIFGVAAPDLVVWSIDGKQYTYKHAALAQMPGLSFAPNTPLFDGEATFTALGDCAEDWSGADHFAAVQTLAFNDASFDRAKDLRLHYAAAWGAAPWDALDTAAGFKISFDLQLEDVTTDSYGIVDKSIAGLSATATFTPQGVTPEQVTAALGIQGAGARRGRSMMGLGNDLVLAGELVGDPEFTLKNAVLKGNSSQFGASVNRVGELSLTSMRSMTAGALDPVFALGIKAA